MGTLLQYIPIVAAFFLPWLIGAMKNSVQNKNRKSLMLAAVLCSVDVFIIVGSILLAYALSK